MCDQEFTTGSKIRVMPDVHTGKGCTIGLTMTITDKVVPNVVGVDIGCGMYTIKLGNIALDMQKLDEIAHIIPSGRNVWEGRQVKFDLTELKAYRYLKNTKYLQRSIGTLGGGNHFIEVDQGKEDYFKHRDAIIKEYKAAGKRNEIQKALKELEYEIKDLMIPEDLCYLYGNYVNDYLHDVAICQRYAAMNRELIAEIILDKMNIKPLEAFHTVHNYIDVEDMILRKGAIAAHHGEKVLIPINMRDGSVLAVGKGNEEWNYSAPHGAGRVLSRGKAKETLTMEEYRKEMDGVYTTSVNEKTLDEAPMAYKSLDTIIDVINESVEILDIMKPIYNFKASD